MVTRVSRTTKKTRNKQKRLQASEVTEHTKNNMLEQQPTPGESTKKPLPKLCCVDITATP
jgi:hypothetical protein